MAMNYVQRPSVFALVLQECQTVQGLSHDELARDMIAAGFPSSLYSAQVPGSTADIAWLATRLGEIEHATLDYLWPFASDATEFIDPAARCFPQVFEAARRMLMAMALDELRRLYP